MSGKYKTKKKKLTGLWIALILALCILLAVILMIPSEPEEELYTSQIPTVGEMQIIQNGQATVKNKMQNNLTIPVGEDLEIQTIGAYTGVYVEDGTNELVTDVLMLKLVNNGAEGVEYAKIAMNIGEQAAEFTATTIPAGAAVILLEKNRMAYDAALDYSTAEVVCENLAHFREPMSLHEDKLSFQILDGAINVTNISGNDITGRITVYYKNKAAGLYYGGITYRITLEDGLKAGEIKQIMASHFAETGSEILFATIAQ